MPYCVQCGNQVRDADRFCGVCGTPQAAPGSTVPPGVPPDVLSGISSRNASLICYIPMVGWIAALVMLASTRFRRDHEVRFNAFQGLYLFVAYLLVSWVLSPALLFPFGPDFGMRHLIAGLLKITVFGAGIFMIVKISQGQSYRLPILGELAERSVAEQH
jgi:uncharacterized membrane protein